MISSNSTIKNIKLPLTDADIANLRAGDMVSISGTLYAARDAAHKRMIDALDKGEELPFDIIGQTIYYVGPCPEKPGQVIGSAGPTTSGRMDAYAPKLISLGLKGMIGKGIRSNEVIEAMKQYGSVYFGATGGAGALISSCIVSQEIVAYSDLGAEALRKFEVCDFQVVVIIDRYGNNIYELGREQYRQI